MALNLMNQVRIHNMMFQQKLVEVLSRQTYLSALPYHGYDILVAFALFTAISWISYFIVAPKMIKYSTKKKVKDDDKARVKWGNMIVSFAHALIISFWSLYLWYDNSLADSLEKRVFGYSPEFGYMFSFTVGYFMWDVCCCLWNFKIYGLGFLIHAILGSVAFLCSFRPFMMYPSSRFLLFEVSTIFLNLHWFLEKLGRANGKLILVNDGAVLLAYLFFRLGFGSYLTYKFSRDLYAVLDRVPIIICLISFLGNFTAHTLNFYWFFKLCRAALRTIGRKKEEKTVKTN